MQSAERAGRLGGAAPRALLSCLSQSLCGNLPKRDPQDSMHPQYLGCPRAPPSFFVHCLCPGNRLQGRGLWPPCLSSEPKILPGTY